MYARCNCRTSTKDNATASIVDINSELNVIFSEKVAHDNSPFQSIDGRLYQKNLVILEGDILFNITRKQWRQTEESVLADASIRNIDVSEVRRQVVEVLSLCRYSIQDCAMGPQKPFQQNKLLRFLKLLKSSITPWCDLEERSLVKLTSPSVTDERLPVCHYFHMYLDVQWLLLTLHYLCEVPLETFEELLKDLVVLSYAIFKKHNQKDVVQVSAFVCTCVKRLWILLQCFSEKLFKRNLINRCFWETFNSTLKDYDSTFSLWLLQHVAMLQGYNEDGEFVGPVNVRVRENHALIDNKLKLLNTKCTNITSDNNQMLLNCCKLIDPLLNQWWEQTAKSEPYQILWEVFNKHINLSFGSDAIKSSAAELVELINRVSNNASTNNSYEYFLYMLIKYLAKSPNQWPRIRGRIYCKLPPQKMNELSDAGLFNITLLFLALASRVNMVETTEKLSALLSNLTHTRRNSPLVLNIYMSLVILHALQGFSVKDVCAPLLQFVHEAADNREAFHLIRLYVDGFDSVLNGSQDFSLQQHLLIGSWVPKYVASCSHNDLCYFLNVLLCNIKRIHSVGAWSEWELALKQYVLPGLKPVATSSNSPAQVGELAAVIDTNPLSDCVLTFTADAIAPKVACQFISTLLEDVAENYVLPKNHEAAILHAWVRCCLLNCENSEKLTKNVMKISALSSIIDARTNFSTNPLCCFIKAISKLVHKTTNLRELCEQCFGRLDCWVVPHITAPPSEPSALHMYTCIAILFFHCATLLYHKNRSSCLLNRLVNAFLLPTDVLMGKSPHPHVLSAIHRTWHLFVQGIHALDCSNDAYLERTLRDMVVRYVPLLPVTDSPVLRCLGNERLAVLVFERIAGAFLSHSSRSSDGNTTKALKIIQLALSTEALELVLQSTLMAVFEVIMFHAHKNIAINIVKHVASCDKYEQVSQCLRIALITVTEKHLAFNANSYFQFTNMLVKIVPKDMRALLPNIKKQVVEVERMRGVGYDNTLRQGLDRLEMLLAQ